MHLLVNLHIRFLHIVQNCIRRRASSRAEIGGSRTCRRDCANPTSSTRNFGVCQTPQRNTLRVLTACARREPSVGDSWDNGFMAPVENVWLPAGNDPAEIVRWIGQNVSDAEYTRRVLLIANKNHFDARQDAVKKYGGNGNIGTNRSPSVTRGGPVFAYAPDLQLLDYARQAADGQLLAVAAHNDEEISGWVAATHALDVLTGERHPGVPDDIREALEDLDDAGYNGYHQRGAFFKAKREEPIATLRGAGYSYSFVAGYLLALGAPARRVGDLKKVYL